MPILKVDASGRPIIDTTSEQTEVPRFDPSGHRYVPQKEEPTQQHTDPDESMKESPQPNPDAEARKIYLAAQKAQKKADAAQKKAQASLSKADAFDKAVSMHKQGGDPLAVLTAAGIDPIKFYQDLTTHALKAKEQELSPDELRIKQKEEKLDNYLKSLEEKEQALENERFNQAHSANIRDQVVPVLEANPDKYESLLNQYGTNAAVEIYNAVLQRYQLDGTVVPFQQAADDIEAYWSNLQEQGLIAASKMKKFADRFGQSNKQSTSPENPYRREQSENTNSSSQKTLTNKQTAQSTPATKSSNSDYKGLRGDAKAAAVLRRLGG